MSFSKDSLQLMNPNLPWELRLLAASYVNPPHTWHVQTALCSCCSSHLYVFSSGPLSDVMFWMFFHNMGSLSWQNQGSCLSVKLAAGLLQISQLLLQCLQHRNDLTSLQHMSEVFSLKLLTQHKVKHANTTPVYFIL